MTLGNSISLVSVALLESRIGGPFFLNFTFLNASIKHKECSRTGAECCSWEGEGVALKEHLSCLYVGFNVLFLPFKTLWALNLWCLQNCLLLHETTCPLRSFSKALFHMPPLKEVRLMFIQNRSCLSVTSPQMYNLLPWSGTGGTFSLIL